VRQVRDRAADGHAGEQERAEHERVADRHEPAGDRRLLVLEDDTEGAARPIGQRGCRPDQARETHDAGREPTVHDRLCLSGDELRQPGDRRDELVDGRHPAAFQPETDQRCR